MRIHCARAVYTHTLYSYAILVQCIFMHYTHALYSCTLLIHSTHVLYSCTVLTIPGQFVAGKFGSGSLSVLVSTTWSCHALIAPLLQQEMQQEMGRCRLQSMHVVRLVWCASQGGQGPSAPKYPCSHELSLPPEGP
jgi:hypothetical protein